MKTHLKTHNKNKNHNHNEIHIHMSDKKTKPRRRRKTTRKPRDASTLYLTFQPAPVPIYTNRPQFLETVTQAQRENPIHSTVRLNDQVPVFSDSTPDASPYLTPKPEYTTQVKVEPMAPLYSKSFEGPYKPFLDNSPIQSTGSFEENIPTISPFRSRFAREAYDREHNRQKVPYELDNKSEASDVTPVLRIPKLKNLRKKVDESLLTDIQMERRIEKRYKAAQKYMDKKMKNLSLS